MVQQLIKPKSALEEVSFAGRHFLLTAMVIYKIVPLSYKWNWIVRTDSFPHMLHVFLSSS